MMTIPQLKAARALLDWTQQDLARASGMHLNVINNIERGVTNPRQQTVERLKNALEESGIVFLGARGVELKREAVTVIKYEGEGFVCGLVEDILKTIQTHQHEILSVFSDIRNLDAHDPAAGKRYVDEKSTKQFQERMITRAMPGFYPRHSEQYRVLAPTSLGPVDFIVYGDRTAYILWQEKEVIVLKSVAMADSQRHIFEILWAQGHQPARSPRAAED